MEVSKVINYHRNQTDTIIVHVNSRENIGKQDRMIYTLTYTYTQIQKDSS